MADLRSELSRFREGRVCLVGLGNEHGGDDGLGMRLARRWLEVGAEGPAVLLAGMSPERHLGFLTDGGFDQVLFLDAVAFGGEPGSVVLLDARALEARFPQVSTHRLSLGLLARWIEQNGHTAVHLLGVQPVSLKPGAALSAPVEAALELLVELLGAAAGEVSDRSDMPDRSDHSDEARVQPTRSPLVPC